MKKFIVFFCLFVLFAAFAAAQVARGGTLYVAIKKADLKDSTGFAAKINGSLNYGDRVTVLQVSGNNVEVRSASNPSISGWTATGNLTPRQITASSSASASAQEVALAGKGFNQEVEDSYKKTGNYNYADVDRVEAISVSDAELIRFLEEGRLSMGGN
jgi:hypothetical protein